MSVKDFPNLYGLASNGKIKMWGVSAVDNGDNTGTVITTHGYVDGKFQEDAKTVKPKNVGRANETTGFEQAISDAQSAFNKKIDKQYVENIEDLSRAPEIPLPMLAHVYEKKQKYVDFPCYVQPKLNGIRCLATKVSEDEMAYTSRGGKYFKTLEHLDSELLACLNVGDTVDGELFSRELEFEEITSIVRNEKEDKGRDQLEYHLYDFPTAEGGFGNRYSHLEYLSLGAYCKLTETHMVYSFENVEQFHGRFMSDHYEGTMVRNIEGNYKFKNRSSDLLKYKDFMDGEYEVIGGTDGEGRFEGVCIFICAVDKDKGAVAGDPHSTFEVVCKGTTESRKEQFKNLGSYIGKMLTVKYQALSAYGVPLFPVGLGFREVDSKGDPEV